MKKTKSFVTTSKVATEIVHSIADAGEQTKEEIERANLKTGNGTPGRIWDFVNTNLCSRLDFVDCMAHTQKRGCWEMVFIYDPNTEYIYTVMREKRYSQLRAEIRKRKNMHYLDILARHVNADLTSPQGQLSFDAVEFQDGSKLKEKFADLVQNFMGQESVIKRYVLILFDESQFELHSVRAVTVDSNLNVVDEADWSEFIPVTESVVASTVSDLHDPAHNPTRSLRLREKAISKKNSRENIVALHPIDTEDTNKDEK